jgi:antitoxin component YwqK of YwqJK toxin-antitoxin module
MKRVHKDYWTNMSRDFPSIPLLTILRISVLTLSIALTSCPLNDHPKPIPGEDEPRDSVMGVITDAYPSGVPRERSTYIGGWKDGHAVQWWGNGAMRAEGEFAHGKREGEWKEWHDNGVQSWSGRYRSGRMVDTIVTWYPTGKKEFEGTYRDGECLKAQFWFDNGQLKSQGSFRGGEKDGKWMQWNEDATVDPVGTGIFEKGRRVSP